MAITVVHLVRHGEVHNPDGVLYGRLPGFHLSERGHQMAQLAATHFAQNIPDVRTIVASPLLRAQETAKPFADHYDLEVRTDERIIEAGNDFEGTVVAEHLRHPSSWPKLRNPGRPSWGEPFADIARRMMVAVRAARAEAEGGHAVLISHQLPIWSTYLSATRASFLHDPRKRRCGLTSVTSFHFVDDDFTGTTYYEPAASLYTEQQKTPR